MADKKKFKAKVVMDDDGCIIITPYNCNLTAPKRDLYDQLPVEFTRDLLRETIKQLDLVTPDWVFLSKWNARGLIKKISKNQFKKIG